jgi:hypothetical protein
MRHVEQSPGDRHAIVGLSHGAKQLACFPQPRHKLQQGLAGHPGGERLLSRAGEDPEGAGDRIGARGSSGSENAKEMVEPKIALDGGAGGGDQVGHLA